MLKIIQSQFQYNLKKAPELQTLGFQKLYGGLVGITVELVIRSNAVQLFIYNVFLSSG